jgi:polysaccharide biosynthesis transport protein
VIPNRVLGQDDYVAMFRRRWRSVAVMALVPLVAGFLVSFAFSPTYTSSSVVQVEKPAVIPAGIVKPAMSPIFLQISFREISERSDRVIALQAQVLSRSNLQSIVSRLGLDKKAKNVDAVIDDIQANASVTEVDLSASLVGTTPDKAAVPYAYATPGFSESFTADNPRDAQQICAELTSSLLTEDGKAREQATEDTTDLIARQLSEARSNLDEQDKKLALFKGQHLGQLPENVDDNVKVLAGLDSQLEASTQGLVRAQQDKVFAESVLAQELTAWKSSQLSTTSDTMEQRLAILKAEFAALQTRYTEDHPEVIKMKNDIAGLEASLKKMSASPNPGTGTDQVVNKAEPQVILQLRQQVHQDEDVIQKAKREQKDLHETIATYKNKLAVSPEVEKEYNLLTRDNQIAHTIYEGLLTSKSESEIHADMEHHRQGEKLRLLNPASLPASPSFPERWKFAAYGLGGGLALGICIAMWLEFRDKAIRDEGDVLAAVELPMLTSIPWVGAVAIDESWRGRFKALLGLKGTA